MSAFSLNIKETHHNGFHVLFVTHCRVENWRCADFFDCLWHGDIGKLGQLVHKLEIPIASYFASIAFITLLVNLNGLAVEASTVLVLSPVSFFVFCN